MYSAMSKITNISLLLVLHFLLRIKAASVQLPKVTTPLGDIQGAILKTWRGENIYAFRAIRYAKAPIGYLRFQPPVPVEKWEGVYNATQAGPVCPQPTDEPVSEDCLLLNVYSTKLPEGNVNPKRAVIVYFHAGGFYSGTAASYWIGPEYLLDKEIVLVTPNYRLGSLGFLSTGDDEAPGNNGLKDQVEALKWVKSNIAAFGGDPDSVTISGYSAGGFSVSLHLVSPLSQGLFHKAIMASGSIFGQYPIENNQFELAQKQARLVGCPDDSTSVSIVQCLRNRSAEELGNSLNGFNEFGNDPVLIWLPVIEKDFGQTQFLTAHPMDLIKSGKFAKVPTISGITKDEFAARAIDVVNNATLLEKLNSEWETYAPIAFQYERDTNNSRIISSALKSFYFGDLPIDNSTILQLGNTYADSIIGFAVNRGVKLLAEKNSQPVYYYRFNYKGRFSHFYQPGSNGTVPYGVVHHDDLIYLFYISRLFPEFSENDPEATTVDRLTSIWANFAKTGYPVPGGCSDFVDVEWTPFTLNNQTYLDISDNLILAENLYSDRYNAWESIFPLQVSN